MKLANAFAMVNDMRAALYFGFLPTVIAILGHPWLLFKPAEVSQIFMRHVWAVYGPGMDENNSVLKKELITPNARGVVLDIGAGTPPGPVIGRFPRPCSQATIARALQVLGEQLAVAVLRSQAK